jgi:hypothetical protein
MHCGNPLGHTGKGLPCHGRQEDDIIAAIHQAIKGVVNRQGGVETSVLVPAATEALLDLTYKQSMFALKHCGYELGDVEEFIRGVELEIHEGLQDVWRQVLERKKGEA